MRPDHRASVRAARSLYGRWHSLPAAERERLAPLAAELKRHALDLPGRAAGESAGELDTAGRELADALEELEGADIRASRGAGTRPDSARGPQAG